MTHHRRYALRDAAKCVCDYCGGRGSPQRKAPLSGPNEAGNYMHVVHEFGRFLCRASSIWSLVAFEWDLDEVADLSPRGWEVTGG